MDVAPTRFAPRTEEQIPQLLTICTAEAQRCRYALAAEVKDALHRRDVNEVPSANVVGLGGFEPPTPGPPDQCAA